jgi:hypothetical protein
MASKLIAANAGVGECRGCLCVHDHDRRLCHGYEDERAGGHVCEYGLLMTQCRWAWRCSCVCLCGPFMKASSQNILTSRKTSRLVWSIARSKSPCESDRDRHHDILKICVSRDTTSRELSAVLLAWNIFRSAYRLPKAAPYRSRGLFGAWDSAHLSMGDR